MSLFDTLGQRNQPDYAAMRQDIGQISAAPGEFLKARGYNIPAGMTDAKQITQYLLQTGQVGAPRLQQVMQLLGRR